MGSLQDGWGEWNVGKPALWKGKKKALVCEGCQFPWCKCPRCHGTCGRQAGRIPDDLAAGPRGPLWAPARGRRPAGRLQSSELVRKRIPTGGEFLKLPRIVNKGR